MVWNKNILENKYNEFLSEMERSSCEVANLPYLRLSKYRFIETISVIPHSSNTLKVLDIGTGIFNLFLKDAFSDYEITTIDINDRFEKECIKRGITFKKVDLTKDSIPFEDDIFDVIIFTEVFEHLFVHPSKIFGEIYRVLKKDGILIFTTINAVSLFKRIRCLFGKPTITSPIDVVIEKHLHVREYGMNECLDFLKNNNFIIEKSRYSDCWDKLGSQLPKFGKKTIIPMLIYICIVKVNPQLRGNIFIVCKKAEQNR